MPTFGRVPKSGCVPLGYSLDHIGPLARTARDCAEVLGVIAGYHPSDPDCIERPVPDYTAGLTGSLEGLRIGVDRVHLFGEGADPAALACFDAAVGVLEGLGATTVEVALPYYAEMLSAMMVTVGAEALAYHRGDLASRWGDYFDTTRLTLARGAMASGADYVEAQRVRRAAQRALSQLLGGLDAIVMPTATAGAPSYDSLDEAGPAGLMSLFATVFTPYWDAVGNPVLALPMGFTEPGGHQHALQHGLPLSLQVAGQPFAEDVLLRIGDAYQQVTDWHRRLPPLVTSARAEAAS
jgi:aspartyl-tRNA(Asn)/glutamyl-tRNA(Gln) amidotransferase subunit A